MKDEWKGQPMELDKEMTADDFDNAMKEMKRRYRFPVRIGGEFVRLSQETWKAYLELCKDSND